MTESRTLKPIYSGKKIIMPDEAMALLDEMERENAKGTKGSDSPISDFYESEIFGCVEGYGKSVNALRKVCEQDKDSVQPVVQRGNEKYVRPLTFRETVETRVNDYERLRNSDGSARTDKERLQLFDRNVSTCTAIIYDGNSERFKIVPVCLDLITMEDFIIYRDKYFLNPYSRHSGEEISGTKWKYGFYMKKEEVLQHPAWLIAVEKDKALLKVYADIVFAEQKTENTEIGMSFRVRENVPDDNGIIDSLSIESLFNKSSAQHLPVTKAAFFIRLLRRIENPEEGERK